MFYGTAKKKNNTEKLEEKKGQFLLKKNNNVEMKCFWIMILTISFLFF